MRFTPAAIALSMFAAVTASVGHGASYEAHPRATALVAEGRSLLETGDTQAAIDSFEAALAVDPAYSDVYLALAEAARQGGLQGKAIRYYREALERDPQNFAAIAGEGEALMEKGAIAKARLNLARLESMCGEGCVETIELAAALERSPVDPVLTAEAVPARGRPTQN